MVLVVPTLAVIIRIAQKSDFWLAPEAESGLDSEKQLVMIETDTCPDTLPVPYYISDMSFYWTAGSAHSIDARRCLKWVKTLLKTPTPRL